MKKIITIVGARPQFIKAAALSRAFKQFNNLSEKIVHTGQHYDYNMSDIFFKELEIEFPAYNLNIGSDSQGAQTGKMLIEIEALLMHEKPDMVVVYGDTNSTLAGALSAAKLHIPVAHVEAGLRSFNRRMPEEVNRVLTDHISDWLFAPTTAAVKNLDSEGISTSKIFLSGDVMYDAVLFYYSKTKGNSSSNFSLPLKDSFILATLHRAENTDDPLRLIEIFNAFDELSKKYPIVIPLHPRTVKMLKSARFQKTSDSLFILDPVGYLDMLKLQNRCSLIITDSGGLQKEAFFMGKYCLTLRKETEWLELVEAGVNVIMPDPKDLLSFSEKFFDHSFDPAMFKLYGDGNASFAIAEILSQS